MAEQESREPAKSKPIILGMMSGSSVDGIDVAAVEIEDCCEATKFELLEFLCVPFDPEHKKLVLELFHYDSSTVDAVCLANALLGELFADAALEMLRQLGGGSSNVACIGVWPQMVYHLPGRSNPAEIGGRSLGAALQLGDLNVIAERTAITTVGSFCARDIAAGGNGAPLTGLGDFVVYHDPARTRVVQNIGGIANANLLPKDGGINDVVGFDTGPGNMVVDEVVRRLTHNRLDFDEDGRIAFSGARDDEFVDEFLADPFIQRNPPKATGREDFGQGFATRFLERARQLDLSFEDTVASATALTVEAIALNYERHFRPRDGIDEVIVGGGGAANPAMMTMLRQRLEGIPVAVDDDYGIPSAAKEAIYMAFLANETMRGHPNNVPSVTGASRPVVMGAIALGSQEAGRPHGI